MARRSVLLSPGDQPEKLRKAPAVGADVVVFDLEDGVAPERKDEARETVRTVLDEIDAGCEVCVRINDVDQGGREDLAVVLDGGPPDSLMVPKTSSVDEIAAVADALASEDADPPILALVESAAGVLAAEGIAAADPVDALVLGAEDLAGDLGAITTTDRTEIAYARQHVLLAARSAGVDAIDTHFPSYEDSDGLRQDAERALGLGYDGKLAIHPDQVPVINDAFTPDSATVEWARRVLDAHEDAAAAGEGVFVVDGEMIDAPQVRQAERVLERAGEQSGEQSPD